MDVRTNTIIISKSKVTTRIKYLIQEDVSPFVLILQISSFSEIENTLSYKPADSPSTEGKCDGLECTDVWVRRAGFISGSASSLWCDLG